MNIYERNHEHTRAVTRKITIAYPKAEFDLILALAVKAMFGTVCPEGLVPSAFLFGELQRMTMPGDFDRRIKSEESSTIYFQIRSDMKQQLDKMGISRA